MDDIKVDKIIRELQERNVLPSGIYRMSSWEQQFSFVYRIEINENVYYLKCLKDRKEHDIDEMKEKLLKEYNALLKFEPIFNYVDNYNIPKPVYYSLDDLLMITEEVKGVPVSSQINAYMNRFNPVDDGIMNLCRRIGGFLKVFNNAEETPYTMEDLDSLVQYIRKRLSRDMFSDNDIVIIDSWMMNMKKTISDNMGKYVKNPIHHDFNLSNIFSDGDSINVVDFGDYKIDHYYQDVVWFKLMVDGLFVSRIKHKKSAKKRIMTAFCEGYGVDLDIISKDALYQMILLKNLAISLKTFQFRKEDKLSIGRPIAFIRGLKDKVVNHFDFNITKKAILDIVAG